MGRCLRHAIGGAPPLRRVGALHCPEAFHNALNAPEVALLEGHGPPSSPLLRLASLPRKMERGGGALFSKWAPAQCPLSKGRHSFVPALVVPRFNFLSPRRWYAISIVMALPLNGRAGPACAALVHLLLATRGGHTAASQSRAGSVLFCFVL